MRSLFFYAIDLVFKRLNFMFKTYVFTKLFLLSILLIILGWILNAMMWTGYFPHRFFESTIFLGLIIMYLGFGLLVVSLILGLFKMIRNV